MKILPVPHETERMVLLNALEAETIRLFCSSLLQKEPLSITEGENLVSVTALIKMYHCFHDLSFYNRVTLHITVTLSQFLQEIGVK